MTSETSGSSGTSGTSGTAGTAGSGARSALGFLTVVGFAASGGPSRRSVAWFAPVGAVLGLAVGAAWWAGDHLWPALLAATLAVAVDAALTGLLHLDGLADSADGLIPPLSRARRLEVMADPRAGGFAVVTVILVLGLRVAALDALEPDPLLLAGVWAMARAAMAVTLATVPYARRDGLASSFVAAPLAPGLAGLAGGLALVVVAHGALPGLAVGLALVGTAAMVVGLAWRRLGGFTGDVLGAAGVVAETLALVVAAARW